VRRLRVGCAPERLLEERDVLLLVLATVRA
jgi:hypothetical protein